MFEFVRGHDPGEQPHIIPGARKTLVLFYGGDGVSRAATLGCAYLMRRWGLSTASALAYIKRGMSCDPNHGFLEQLEEYEQLLKSKQTE